MARSPERGPPGAYARLRGGALAVAGLIAAGWLGGCAVRPAPQAAPATHHMIATANPLASRAGLAILRQGGSAVDAAIAAEMVLNLVEPQSSGLGGGAFLLHYQADTAQLSSFDGRETAPKGVSPTVFLKADGTPESFKDAALGGRAVGTPGLLRMLAQAWRHFGRLPWPTLFQPAIALARNGFPVSPRLAREVAEHPDLRTFPTTAAYFYPGGRALRPGQLLTNPALARTLERIAQEGPRAFYEGAIAADIARTVQRAPIHPGTLATTDLAAYRTMIRRPVCLPFRLWLVCSVPPPSSGGLAVLQILGILAHDDLSVLAPDSPEALHLFAEASRLAFADRDWAVADPDFVTVPEAEMLDPDYLARRAASIDPHRDTGVAWPGIWHMRLTRAAWPISPERPSTTQVSVVDDSGNAVSMTASIEAAFGSKLMVDGFLLNNEMTDFSFAPKRSGLPLANRVAPGKRPRSSMAPAMVFGPEGALVLVIGSPGGPNIIDYVARTILGVLEWDLPLQAAIELPHVVNRNGPTLLEAGTKAAAAAPALEAMGHKVEIRRLNSGLYGIEIRHPAEGPVRLEGGADRRREGVALGD